MATYLYGRYSSDEQKNGDSEDRQIRKGKVWADANKTTIKRIYFDRGVSGFHGDNRKTGEFAELLKVVKPDDVILIENQDRFGRDDTLPAMNALQDIARKRIRTIFLDDNIEVNEHNFYDLNVFLPTLLKQLLGREENRKKADRLAGTWHQKRRATANGVILTPMIPAWLEVVNKEFRKREKEIKVVLRIFESYASGKPIRTIVKALNVDRVRPFGKGKQNKGNGWSATHVRRLLSSRSVIGEYLSHTCANKSKRHVDTTMLPVPDYYPRIISNELFYQCEQILSRNVSAGSSKTNATNLFTGLVKCAHCKGGMHIKDGSKGKYSYTLLFCANANNNAKCDCKNKIQYKHVESAVLTLIWSKVIPNLTEENERVDKLVASRGELEDVTKQIERLTIAIAETDTMPKSFTKKIAEMEARQALLASDIEKLEALANDNPLTDWIPCEQTDGNRLRLQNILRGEIESLKIDTRNRKAWLTLKDPAITFDMTWDYQKANRVKKNPADIGFTVTDRQNSDLTNTYMHYLDGLLVWRNSNFDVLVKYG